MAGETFEEAKAMIMEFGEKPEISDFQAYNDYRRISERVLSQLDDATKDKTVDIEWLQAEFRELYNKFKENGDSNNQRKMIDSGRQIIKMKVELMKDIKQIETSVPLEQKLTRLTALVRTKAKEKLLDGVINEDING